MNKTKLADATLAAQVGACIRDVRRRKHITQVELARRVGIRAGPMNTLEKGRHVPSGRVLFRIAQALEVRVDDLFPAAEETDVQDAKLREKPAAYVVRTERRARYGFDDYDGGTDLLPLDTAMPSGQGWRTADEIARAFLALEDLCGAMKSALLPLNIPFAATETGLELLAMQVRHHLGITNAVVFDYLELLENIGLRVVFVDLPALAERKTEEPPDAVESVSAWDGANNNAFFYVRRGMNPERQLFRLLMELGRLYGRGRARAPAAGELDELHAARKFAAFFLMPAAAVRATVGQLGIGPEGWSYELLLRVKHRFGVSAQAFCFRLKELGLLAPELAERFNERIGAHYAATNYAEPAGSLRRLARNGRLGDLLHTACARPSAEAEARQIAARLRRLGVDVKLDGKSQ